jgi:cysteate synthase
MAIQAYKTPYKLQSVKTGVLFEDAGWQLEPLNEKEPTLIRSIYEKKQIEVKDNSYGLYKFADWLPINRMLEGSSAPVTYKSKGLARKLGLSNLWITFSGYWPEKNAFMKTCSFKETEAYSVCARMAQGMDKTLVVASAGNTSRSFAQVCSDNKIPLLLCVPEDYIDTLWFEEEPDPCVKLICSQSGSDYFDAIHLSNIVAGIDGFLAEGGAKNVARRDGMGTTVLSAVTTIGQIPAYYFQAVGSGTGAISAWEANLRFLEDGRFGSHKMKLLVSQNYPFKPLQDAWRARSRTLLPMDEQTIRQQVEEIDCKVLSNRKPPYSVFGGLFDALSDTNGDVLTATNREAREAVSLFEETEGIDIYPAAGVATATLIQAVKNQSVDKNALILLNITGGGENLFRQEKKLHYLKPERIFSINPDSEEVKEKVASLF